MLEDEGLKALVQEIESQGYDRVTAGHYAALIGDTPEFDGSGYVVVRDDGDKILARLKPLNFFEE